jgi:hypothetical protein
MGSPIPIRRDMPEIPNHLHFTVCQDRFGRWLAIEDRDLAGGLFASKEAALRFCAFESNHAPGAVELVADEAAARRGIPHLAVVRG